jgi:hypothetical protein
MPFLIKYMPVKTVGYEGIAETLVSVNLYRWPIMATSGENRPPCGLRGMQFYNWVLPNSELEILVTLLVRRLRSTLPNSLTVISR